MVAMTQAPRPQGPSAVTWWDRLATHAVATSAAIVAHATATARTAHRFV